MKNILPGHHGYELIEVDAPVHLLVLLTVLDHGLQFLLGGTETVLSQNLQFRTLVLLAPSQGWMRILFDDNLFSILSKLRRRKNNKNIYREIRNIFFEKGLK